MSNLAYSKDKLQGDLSDELGPGWEVLHTSDDFFGKEPSGYFAVTFVNKYTGDRVVAHRGTVPSKIKNLWTDLMLALGCRPNTEKYAKKYTQYASTADTSRTTHVGHSLGGCLAILSAVQNSQRFVTFDAAYTDKMIKNDKTKDKISGDSVNYIFSPNVINWVGDSSIGYHQSIPWRDAQRNCSPFLPSICKDFAYFHPMDYFKDHFVELKKMFSDISKSDFTPEKFACRSVHLFAAIKTGKLGDHLNDKLIRALISMRSSIAITDRDQELTANQNKMFSSLADVAVKLTRRYSQLAAAHLRHGRSADAEREKYKLDSTQKIIDDFLDLKTRHEACKADRAQNRKYKKSLAGGENRAIAGAIDPSAYVDVKKAEREAKKTQGRIAQASPVSTPLRSMRTDSEEIRRARERSSEKGEEYKTPD